MKSTYIEIEKDNRINRLFQGCIACGGFGPITVQGGHYDPDTTVRVDDEVGACAWHVDEVKDFVEQAHDFDFVRAI